MADLTFAQSDRRNYTAPLLITLALLVLAGSLAYKFLPRRSMAVAVTHTALYPIHTVYKKQKQTGSPKVVDQGSGEYDLYVVPTIRIENDLAEPIFLKDFTVTLTTKDGEMRTSAIEKPDLDTVYTAYPAVKLLMPSPLFRESEIPRGQTAEGSILDQFTIPQTIWDERQSASVTIDFYHQPSVTIPIPKP